LTEAIQQVQARRGCVLMPTFALGRTQEILALLAMLMEAGKSRVSRFTLAAWAGFLLISTIKRPTWPIASTRI
jgi:Cft2 family RNA processing exonuclease